MPYVAIVFAGIVVFHARGLGSSVLVADFYHPSSDPFLHEQMLINISDKVKFHTVILRAACQDKQGKV